jgi:biotin synthase
VPDKKESPEYIRVALSTAMQLRMHPGAFWRGAQSPCVNILVTYDSGCAARCSFCGLAKDREGAYRDKSFIHVAWPTAETREVAERCGKYENELARICISQITRRRSIDDTLAITAELRKHTQLPISYLVAPTVLKKEDYTNFKSAGADRIGIAVDCATPGLFDRIRGASCNGPHRWESYWRKVDEACEVFGSAGVGVHLIVGLGETEREMLALIQEIHGRGMQTHLFSFRPEPASRMAAHPAPSLGRYRRVQVGLFLIERGLAHVEKMTFDTTGRLTAFGVYDEVFINAVEIGEPFMTTGCAGLDGKVACNRPFANSPPGPELRNYPVRPSAEDAALIREQIWT